ncbi:GGDEF domain-containing protein [Paraneptunicella aestuarii]|uniref:GGDEF domain-containing protein n=1 Tax=Paraneptunicella aestuarii TaxID=2831148 RepID=UPI001E55BA09|nr:GGDEF domain-containing protein [Paraneptunicella aestuarii]UAA38314.1 GGDEF domain-containing protein [Paraneptunicella aestuarii]
MKDPRLASEEFQRRIDFDFVKRAMPGLFIYAVVWPILFLATGYHEVAPLFCWSMAGAFTFFSIARYTLAMTTRKVYDLYPTFWRVSQFICTCAHAALWSVLFYQANHSPDFEAMATPINLTTAGIASASSIALIPKLRLTQTYVIITLLPTGMLTLLDPEQWHLGLIVIFFLIYMLVVNYRIYREYLRAFKIECSLQEKQDELRNISQTDFLTKTYNRLFFNECISQQWFLSQRNKKQIALLMIDIDHFKIINDKYGHIFGDECLVHTAKVIRHVAKRRSDMVVRYGGEEFAVILPQTDIIAATRIAEAIRVAMDTTEFSFDNITITITASVGVCAMLPIGNDYKVLLQQADDALYKAKNNGRNRVEISDLNHVEDIP